LKTFYESGNLKSHYSYASGAWNGAGRDYYESGNLKYEAQGRNGKPDGMAYTYYENGKVLYQDWYEYGRLMLRKTFDPLGTILKQDKAP